MTDDELTDNIITCGSKAHKALGEGFSEGVDENALRQKPIRQSQKVMQQGAIQACYAREVDGEFVPDHR